MTEEFGTLEDFLAFVKPSVGNAVFRGESNAGYSLLPSVGRVKNRGKDLNFEENLLKRYKLKAAKFSTGFESKLDHLVRARHYGLPTRLLDWTRSPYVALFFALEGFDARRPFPITVYVVENPRMVSYFDINDGPFDLETTCFFEPPHLDDRIVGQQALLSIHNKPFSPFDAANLTKFNIEPSAKSAAAIERTLFEIGLGHSVIYPGLDGICRDLKNDPGLLPTALHLAGDRPQWKTIPFSWSCRPWVETRLRLITERRLSEFLNWKCDADVVGIELQDQNGTIGILLACGSGYIRIFNPETRAVQDRHWSDGSVDDLKVSARTIEAFFPSKDVTFRTKRPQRAGKDFQILLGAEAWSGAPNENE